LDARDPVAPPTPATMSQPMLVATRSPANNLESTGVDPIAVASISEQSTRPAPRVLLSQERTDSSSLLAAYVPVIPEEPDAQRALQMLIERRNTDTVTVPDLRGTIVTASLGPVPTTTAPPAPLSSSDPEQNSAQGEYATLFNGTFQAVEKASLVNDVTLPNIAQAFIKPTPTRINLPINMRAIEFYAPEFEHMTGSLTMPTFVAGDRYAILYEPDESHFNPATELGPQSGQISFTLSETQPLMSDRFTHIAPIILTDI